MPVTVKFTPLFVGAKTGAASVSVLADEVTEGEKLAVTCGGRVDVDRLTALLKPLLPVTVTGWEAEPACVRYNGPVDVCRPKSGSTTETYAVCDWLPLTPVIATR